MIYDIASCYEVFALGCSLQVAGQTFKHNNILIASPSTLWVL